MSSMDSSFRDLPWFNSLRICLDQYRTIRAGEVADIEFSSPEIIQAVEMHHGVPQAGIPKDAAPFIPPDIFVRAMHYLGFIENSTGDLQLVWRMAKK